MSPTLTLQQLSLPTPVASWKFEQCPSLKLVKIVGTFGEEPAETVIQNVSLVEEKEEWVGYFDGFNSGITVADQPEFHFSDRMTLTAWVKPFRFKAGQTLINKWYAMDSYALSLQDHQFTFTVALPGGQWGKTVDVKSPAILNVWTHLVGVFDGEWAYLYVNGKLAGKAQAKGKLQQSDRPICIGYHPSWNAFRGLIRQIQIYDVALDESQVQHVFHQSEFLPLGEEGEPNSPNNKICLYQETLTTIHQDLEDLNLNQQLPSLVARWYFDRDYYLNGVFIEQSQDTAQPPDIHNLKLEQGYLEYAGVFQTSRIDIPDRPSFHLTHQLTLTAWVKPTHLNGIQTIINKWYAMDSYSLSLHHDKFAFTLAFPGGQWGKTVDLFAPARPHVWTHIAGVYNGELMLFYLNGQLYSWAKISGNLPLQDSNRPLSIGHHPNGNYFQGLIEEIRLYNTALAPQHIQQLFDLFSSHPVHSTPQGSKSSAKMGLKDNFYQFDFSVQIARLSEDWQQGKIEIQDLLSILFEASLTARWSVYLLLFEQRSYKIQQALREFDANCGLIAYYRFDNWKNLGEDQSGNQNHAQVYGKVSCVEGILGKALQFNGFPTQNSLLIPNSLPSSEYSISFWVQFEQLEKSSSLLLINSELNAETSDLYIGIEQHQLTLIAHQKPLFQDPRLKLISLEANQFYLVTLVYQTDEIILYLNTTPYAHCYSISRFNWRSQLIQMGYAFVDQQPHQLNGILDDVRLYNRALTELEISALYLLGLKPDLPVSHSSSHLDEPTTRLPQTHFPLCRPSQRSALPIVLH